MTSRLTAERWQRIERILDEALACEAHLWPALLDRECGDDPECRAELESLLQCSEQARGFLETPPATSAAALIADVRGAVDDASYVASRIGAYRIVREVGRGGMSRVFLAERAEGDFTHRVAIKLLRPGLDTEVDQARFRAERQILARLNHPNIAQLLDGGTTDNGLPFFVLEYVDGHPIDAYASDRNLSIAQRIAVFLTVCEATQYAHRNLVVHRDLKPTNILVTQNGDVKLLDFGLAKLLESADGGQPRVSRTVQRWMTPEYAAPEQIRGDAVTTLTDVYQLGAVLYELLTGAPPFAQFADDLRKLENVVLTEEPGLPSSAVAPDRRKGVAALLRGDLDAILLKALRKEADARYASVDAFAEDLRRHLSGHPVEARRSTLRYRARRFVRRHRIETLAVLGVSLSLIAGVAISVSQARRARIQRARADSESRASASVTTFLLRLFEASDPIEARGDTLTAYDLVRRAMSRVERLSDQPAMQAGALEVTARLYQSLGGYGEAYEVLQRALNLRERIGQGSSLEMANALRQASDVLVILGRNAAADSMARRALAIQARLLGPGDPTIVGTLAQLGNLQVHLGDLARAESYLRQSLELSHRVRGEADSVTITGHLSLGAILQRRGYLVEAEGEYRRAITGYQQVLGSEHTQLAEAILHLAYLIDRNPGRYAEAESLYQRGLEIRRRGYGNAHPLTAAALSDLAGFYSINGKHKTAVQLQRQSLEITRKAFGPGHPTTVLATHQTADLFSRAGQLSEAENLYRTVIGLHRKGRGDDGAWVAGPEAGLARVLIERKEYNGAEALLKDAVRLRRRTYGPGHPQTAQAEALWGMLAIRMGKYPLADSLLQHARSTLEQKVTRAHPDVRAIYGLLADLEQARGRSSEAATYRAISRGLSR